MKKSALKKLIKEALSKPKDSCNCGCNTCENVGNPGVLLNEGISKKYLISENIQFHVDNKIPLTENTFRYGSDSFLKLWNEARYLYLREAIYVNDDDKEILEETDLGNYGIYEGEKVPLDMPMEQEETINFDIKIINGVTTVLATFGNNKIGALRLKPYKDSYQVDQVGVRPEYRKLGIGKEMYRLANDELGPLYSDEHQTTGAKMLWQSLIDSGEAREEDGRYKMIKEDIISEEGNESSLLSQILKAIQSGNEKLDIDFRNLDKSIDYLTSALTGMAAYDIENLQKKLGRYAPKPQAKINEAKFKGKEVALNKPKRGGSKAYYVYVRDPKTKKIKKVSFGSGGLKAKINNPKARQAFAKRHRCSEKTDKTKASYWSCRLPRYASLLGLKSSFSGFW